MRQIADATKIVKKAMQCEQGMLYEQREILCRRTSYEVEKHMLQMIREGEPEKLAAILNVPENECFVVGNMSANELRQAQYLAVTFVAFATRASMDGGMPEVEAYCMSDEFIQRIDKMKTAEQVLDETLRMVIEIASRVRICRERCAGTRAVRLCTNYIQEHLHYRISIAELCDACGLSPSRISHLFQEQLKISPMAYIRKCKLREACDLLIENRIPCGLVAEVLCFSSQSHFITCFKKEYGITPGVFIRH